MALNHDEMKPFKINLPAQKTLQYPLHIDSLISIIIFNPHKYLAKQIITFRDKTSWRQQV